MGKQASTGRYLLKNHFPGVVRVADTAEIVPQEAPAANRMPIMLTS